MSRLHFRSVPAIVSLLALMVLATLPLPASGAKARRARYIEGEAVVCFRPEVAEEQALAVLQRHQATITKRFSSKSLFCVRLAKGVTTELGVRRFALEQDVSFCQPNFIYAAVETRPNDRLFQQQWGVHNTGQQRGLPNADIDAPEAWDLTQGSRDVVVAVIDSGVDYGHPDLAPNMWTNPGEIPGNQRDDDGNGYVDDIHGWDAWENDGDPQDVNGHGTHVAGTIGAAGNNNLGVAGVNWRVSMIAARFLNEEGAGTTSGAIECLDYLHTLKDRGVNIIATNNSWGGVGEPDLALREAIQRSQERGILFIAAAGNEGLNNSATPSYPANYDLPNVITVAATDRADRLASFSNYGARQVHLAAPGVEILSTIPRFMDSNSPYRYFSGTSMAAPHVTGAAALLKAYDPSLDYATIRNRLLTTGDPLASLQGVTVTGRRLNVYQALIGGTPPPVNGPELDVTLKVARKYKLGRIANFRVLVNDPRTGARIAGATVRATVQTPNGDLYSAEALTNNKGQAKFRFRISRTDGRGTYLLTASANRTGYTQGAESVTFEVR